VASNQRPIAERKWRAHPLMFAWDKNNRGGGHSSRGSLKKKTENSMAGGFAKVNQGTSSEASESKTGRSNSDRGRGS